MDNFPQLPFSYDFSYFLTNPAYDPANIYMQEHPGHHTPAVMSTPVRRKSPPLQDEGSWTMPSRKRAYDAFTPAGPSKVRRTAPTPASDPFSHQGDADAYAAEIIDLTGDDDDDLTSSYIIEQIKAEKIREQEKADRDLAQLLSSQDSLANPLAGSFSGQHNAFDRIMGSQLPSGSSTGIVEDDYESSFTSMTNDLEPNVPQMPGGYDSSWDAPIAIRQTSQSPAEAAPTRSMIERLRLGAGALANSHVPPVHNGLQTLGQPSNPGPNPGLSRGYGMSPRPGMPSNGGPSDGRILGPQSMSSLPAGGFSSLSDIISRTSIFSTFDYSLSMDPSGNALPERLTNYLQDAYHDPRMSDKELDDLLQNIRPDMDIPERNRDGTPAGLKRPLYPHQELAVAWMKKMEQGTNHGGILADDMGLGKTISTLALLLANPATTRPKTNLIVGPVALMRQWQEEILTKTKLSHRLSVIIHHNKKSTPEELLKYDVVLTTYGTLASELKRLEKYLEENADRNIDMNDRTLAEKCPLLHPTKAKFYRVVLDEAQCIKNKDTQTAKACAKLKAKYRWCLTGTPMMNGVGELYSLLNFLQIKPYCKWEEFRQAFGVLFGRNGDPKSMAMNRLRALLKAIMLRRKKNSKLDGKPILKLPEKTEEVVYAELSPDERDFYTQLEKKSQVMFSKYLREGSVGKNYSSILVLLLRLRQACCHPHLNLDVDDAAAPISDEQMMVAVKALDAAVVERIKSSEDFECPICYDVVQNPAFFVPCGHDSCSECLCRIAENASAQNILEGTEDNKAKCPVCRSLFDPTKCFSYEAFQKVYMPEKLKELGPTEEGSDDDDDDGSDDSDEVPDSEDDALSDDEVDKHGNLRDFIVADESGPEDGGESKKKARKKKGKKKATDIRPSMLKTLRKEAYKNRHAFQKYMRYLRKTWMPAAKVTECVELLKKISETGEKTIIFSQWTLLLDLIEVAMGKEKMTGMARYDGSMSAIERDRAAHSFREDKKVKVMLVSLRAGNAGLNLTAASRVIIMDPFWNPYIEMQAVDRAYRIGQQREVKVYRILTKDTVEDRIVDLQNRKKDMVEAALDEAESVKIGRLSTGELKFLFNARG
ncbi:SNF2 family N-terminal domain-containing protein [Mariannaea sp. PMI_226]|nr:SNF2 family N-terminal domain-containing protein [Mariannaea sp. PMI_226]